MSRTQRLAVMYAVNIAIGYGIFYSARSTYWLVAPLLMIALFASGVLFQPWISDAKR